MQALTDDAHSITEYSDFGKLGMLAAVVDDAATDFVLGPCGSKNRPAGMLDIEYLHNADRAGWLSNEEKIRWSKLVQIWAQAGFELQRLLLITSQLRCLQYGSDLDLADLPSVTREQLDDCLAEYCETQEEADMLRDFVDLCVSTFLKLKLCCCQQTMFDSTWQASKSLESSILSGWQSSLCTDSIPQ